MFWIFLAMTLISLIPFNPQKLGRKMHAIRRACSVLNPFQWVRLWDVKHPPSLLDAFLCLFCYGCYGVFRKTRIVTTWVIISVRKRFGSHRKPPPQLGKQISSFRMNLYLIPTFAIPEMMLPLRLAEHSWPSNNLVASGFPHISCSHL